MRYSHHLKFKKSDAFRDSLSRIEKNLVNKWLDSPVGIKKISSATGVAQKEAVSRWRAWEKENGFEGSYAKYTNVPKEIEAELKEIIAELDKVVLAQLKIAYKFIHNTKTS